MQRTIKTIITNPNAALVTTIELSNIVTNEVLKYGFKHKKLNIYRKLHDKLYKKLRKQFPQVQSSLIQGCIETAFQILKRNEQEKNKTLPIKKSYSSVRYNLRTFTPYLNSNSVSISTINKRRKYEIKFGKYFEQYKTHKIKSMRLRIKGKRVECDFTVELPTPKIQLQRNPKVIGVDFGIRNPAVTSDNKFYGKEARRIKRKYAYNRRVLQRVGTRSAHKKLQKLSGRERRFQRDKNHCIAKQIVNSADVIVLENLNGIRENRRNTKGTVHNRKLHSWSYSELLELIQDKAESNGKLVLLVPPQYTSQECSKCNKIGKRDKVFTCKSCNYTLNADINAARNISNRGKSLISRFQSMNQKNEAVKDAYKPLESTFKPTSLLVGN